MMTLIGLAIVAAYLWSVYATFADMEALFWGADHPSHHHAPGSLARDAGGQRRAGRAEGAFETPPGHRRSDPDKKTELIPLLN